MEDFQLLAVFLSYYMYVHTTYMEDLFLTSSKSNYGEPEASQHNTTQYPWTHMYWLWVHTYTHDVGSSWNVGIGIEMGQHSLLIEHQKLAPWLYSQASDLICW